MKPLEDIFIVGIDKLILNFIGKCQEPKIIKPILNKNTEKLILFMLIKTVWYWHKDK